VQAETIREEVSAMQEVTQVLIDGLRAEQALVMQDAIIWQSEALKQARVWLAAVLASLGFFILVVLPESPGP